MVNYLVSCDNATCAVPEAYREIFRGDEEVVASAEGWEPGALNLAQAFAMKFRTPLVHGDVTRLLIDLGRDGDDRWSRFSLKLAEATRQKVAERHEKPYRTLLVQRIGEDLRRHSAVVHLMVHTDAATDGRVTLATRPGAEMAEQLAATWCSRLSGGEFDVRQQRQEEGTALATGLAGAFPATRYAQVRLAVSQSFFLEGRPLRWEVLKKRLLETLEQATASVQVPPPQQAP